MNSPAGVGARPRRGGVFGTQVSWVVAASLVESLMPVILHVLAPSSGPFMFAAVVGASAAALLAVWLWVTARRWFPRSGGVLSLLHASVPARLDEHRPVLWRILGLRNRAGMGPARPMLWLLACRGDIPMYTSAVALAGAPTAAVLFESWPAATIVLFAVLVRQTGAEVTRTPKAAMLLSVAGVALGVAAQHPDTAVGVSGAWFVGIAAGAVAAASAGGSAPVSFAAGDTMCENYAAGSGSEATTQRRMWFTLAALALSWAVAAPVNAAVAVAAGAAGLSWRSAAGAVLLSLVVVGHGLGMRYAHLAARYSPGAFVWCFLAPVLGMVWLWGAGATLHRPLLLAAGLGIVVCSNTFLLTSEMKP